MRHARVFLSRALVMAWLGSGAGLAAAPGAAGDPAHQPQGQGRAPIGLRLSAWHSIQSQVAKLTASDGLPYDRLGNEVSVGGNWAVAGARWATVGGDVAVGAAYVFQRNEGGADSWGQVEKLTASDGEGYDYFGTSVTVSGGTVLSGAEYATIGGNWAQGAAYVFVWPNAAPVAADDAYTTALGVPLAVAAPGVLLNDTDAEGDPLTAALDTEPSHGTLELQLDGSLVYTPAPHFVGVDSFSYHAGDGAATSTVAAVKITVTGRVIYLPLVLRNG